MKRWTRLALFAAVAAAAACAPRERTIVVLSTNDMHAKIQHFPRLAAAVEACRDTVPDALLVDGRRPLDGQRLCPIRPPCRASRSSS